MLALCLALAGAARAQGNIVWTENFTCTHTSPVGPGAWDQYGGAINGYLNQYTELPSWIYRNNLYQAQGAILFQGYGNVVTPALNVEGDGTLRFAAHAFKGHGSKVRVTVFSGNGSLVNTDGTDEWTIPNTDNSDWGIIEVPFTGVTPNTMLRISVTGDSENWFFVDYVQVEVAQGSLIGAELSFSETSCSVNLGDAFTAPTLTKRTDAAVTYSSSDPSVATVDATTGQVTPVGSGTTTITATTEATDVYTAGLASYSLKVVDLSTMHVMAPAKRITGTQRRYFFVVPPTVFIDGYRYATPTVSDGYLNAREPFLVRNDTMFVEDLSCAFTLTAVDGGYYTIQDQQGRYLWIDGSYDYDFIETTTYDDDEWNKWTISEPDENHRVMMTHVLSGRSLYFNSSTERFVTYSSSWTYRVRLYEEPNNRVEPEVSFADDVDPTYNLYAISPTTPTLNTNSDGAVSYSCSDPSVATVDATTGKLTIVGLGTATITAHVGETETYYPATASYALTVKLFNEYRPIKEIEKETPYLLTTDGATSGSVYTALDLVLEEDLDYGRYYFSVPAKSAVLAGGFLAADESCLQVSLNFESYDGSTYYAVYDPVNSVYITAGTNDELWWAVDSSPLIYDNEGGVAFFWSNLWTFTQQGENSFVLKAGAGTDELTLDQSSMKFVFNGAGGAVPVKFFELSTITILPEGYGTFYSDNAIVLPDGLKAGIITQAASGTELSVEYLYQAGDVIPAGTPLLVCGAEGSYAYYVAESADVAPAGNMLRGSTFDVTTEGEGCQFYKLGYDANGENIGFYWGADEGAAFMSEAGTAYLPIPAAEADASGYPIAGLPTGIDQVVTTPAASAPSAIYTLDGRRVQGSASTLRPGFYIINGQKVIVK